MIERSFSVLLLLAAALALAGGFVVLALARRRLFPVAAAVGVFGASVAVEIGRASCRERVYVLV